MYLLDLGREVNLLSDYLVFFHPLLMPGAVVLGAMLGGPYYFLTVFLVLVVHPFCDYGLGSAAITLNPSKRSHLLFNIPALLFVPLELAVFLWSIHHYSLNALSPVEALGLILSTGFITGTFGFTLAHEFIHRKNPLFRGIGMMLLYAVSYPHYRIFHINWHHRFVATPEDPGTARKGEPLYLFWLRAIRTNIYIAFSVEKRRMKSLRRKAYSLQNHCLQFLIVQLSLYALAYYYFGFKGVIFYAGQSLVAVLLLETIHYLEHYGLRRTKLQNGNFEPIGENHSWDSNYRYTNWYLFNLGFHSDHHLDPVRPYEQLKLRPRALLMPFGLSTMLLMALIPKLWFRIMDPKLTLTQPNPAEGLKIGTAVG